MLINPQLSLHKPNSLTSTIQHLQANLQALQPKSTTSQLITYTLIGVALTGIMVYHYIKKQEARA